MTKIKRLFNLILKAIKSINITNIKKMLKLIKTYGFKDAIKKLKFVLTGTLNVNRNEEYKEWIKANEPTLEELELQKNYSFKYNPKISIIVPMYNTKVKFFEELVDSLILQTYSNWELCLADGSPEKNKEIEKIAEKDRRIKYKFLNENKNISRKY